MTEESLRAERDEETALDKSLEEARESIRNLVVNRQDEILSSSTATDGIAGRASTDGEE